jgi:hypothetical protein
MGVLKYVIDFSSMVIVFDNSGRRSGSCLEDGVLRKTQVQKAPGRLPVPTEESK